MKLSKTPSSTSWPGCLDPSYSKTPGRWDPERWMKAMHDNSRPSNGGIAPTTTSGPAPRQERPPDIEIKRSRDPRERVKVYFTYM